MIISFNKEIYPLEPIQKAVKAYKGLARFSVVAKKDYFIVNLTKIDKEVKTNIGDEFRNYVLAEIRS
ncbi:MAG: HxsD-like protein [Candidatus Parcubacteria bacterium]|nr:HxsD-like protein [Candidatus Parcubacteria bacterium]